MTANPQVKPTQEQIEWAIRAARIMDSFVFWQDGAKCLAQALAEREAKLKQKADEATSESSTDEGELDT